MILFPWNCSLPFFSLSALLTQLYQRAWSKAMAVFHPRNSPHREQVATLIKAIKTRGKNLPQVLPVCPCWCNGPSNLLSWLCCFSSSCVSQTALLSWVGYCCLLMGLKIQNILGEKCLQIQMFLLCIKSYFS